jgi:6-phosphofructokinase
MVQPGWAIYKWDLAVEEPYVNHASGVADRLASGTEERMPRKKRILVATGGGDCPGLNAVIRAIVKRAIREFNWEVIGSIGAFDGVLREPMELRVLDMAAVSGIHVRGGTIEAVINIGGDGSQRISQQLYKKGLNIIGVPKTIDNDLSSTDFTFGYQTAVEVATDAVDKLVTTAESHNRMMVLEVMGRDAGWIALGAAIAGGADIVLIPEIPYRVESVLKKIEERTLKGRGFVIVVVAEGAHAFDGEAVYTQSGDVGHHNPVLGGIGRLFAGQIKRHFPDLEVRVTVLGHLQRGGIPCAFDRILATQFGVAAVDLIEEQKYGYMVSYRHPNIVALPIEEAISKYNSVDLNSCLVKTARGLGICLGD